MALEDRLSVRSNIRHPQTRTVRADISNPSYQNLFDFAAARVWEAACPLNGSLPRSFPTAETAYGDYFTHEDWHEFGDLETELARLKYTLSRFTERGLPTACASTIRELLTHSDVLIHWESVLPELRIRSEITMQQVILRMQRQSPREKTSKKDFITLPVDYDVDEDSSKLALCLWRRSVADMASQFAKDDVTHAASFLEIHSFLKDPICGLFRSWGKRLHVFHLLLESVKSMLHGITISPDARQRIVAQASQESALLGVPYLEDVAYLHFCGHQQLPYMYVPWRALSRSEFSKPAHVLEMIREILLSKQERGLCPIAPITIAIYPTLDIKIGNGETTIIIDGNHRVTAAILLHFLATKSEVVTREADAKLALQKYCGENKLGQKWQLDLLDALQELFKPGSESCLKLIHDKKFIVGQFRDLKKMPALVTQEEDFHTVCTQRSPLMDGRPRLLLPMHQAIYNSDSLSFALPNAGQRHGRSIGFKAMPLMPFAHRSYPECEQESSDSIVLEKTFGSASESELGICGIDNGLSS